MKRLAIHIKSKDTERNKAAILLSYYDITDSGALSRVMAHRGIDKRFLLTRLAEEDEYQSESHPTRIGFLPYNNWNALIKDELKFTNDPVYLADLEKLKQEYPQFNSIHQPQLF